MTLCKSWPTHSGLRPKISRDTCLIAFRPIGSLPKSAYKAIGLNYIRFAAEETEFFKLLFMSQSSGKDILTSHTEQAYVLQVLEQEENIKGTRAQDIYEEMWLFSHGIATMIATGTATFTPERIKEMLTAVYRGLIKSSQE